MNFRTLTSISFETKTLYILFIQKWFILHSLLIVNHIYIDIAFYQKNSLRNINFYYKNIK